MHPAIAQLLREMGEGGPVTIIADTRIADPMHPGRRFEPGEENVVSGPTLQLLFRAMMIDGSGSFRVTDEALHQRIKRALADASVK